MALFSAGFRPFFLLASAWAAIAVPVWLAAYVHGYALRGALPALFWHAHEMVFGFGFAAVAGFLLTAIPNWTGRLPVRGPALAALAALWLAGRVGLLMSAQIGALVGGRIVPSFTRNWLAKARRGARLPAPEGILDRAALLITLVALAAWVFAVAEWPLAVAGLALAARLARWRGEATLAEPLLVVLHLGYAWLALGLIFVGIDGSSAALHALTVGAIGTMTLAVMTRASLGHSGRELVADGATRMIYALVSAAAVLRVASAFSGAQMPLVTSLSSLAWSAAFVTFAIHYGRFLIQPRLT